MNKKPKIYKPARWAPGHGVCRDYDHYTHPEPEFMEIIMDIVARLSLAKAKVVEIESQNDSLKADSAAKDTQIADLQKQIVDLNTAASSADAGKVDIAAVTPLVDALIGPDPDLAAPAAPVAPIVPDAPADAAAPVPTADAAAPSA